MEIFGKPYTRIKAENASTSDAIVVLGGSRHPAPGKSKILEWRDPDRFLAGVQLFKESTMPVLLEDIILLNRDLKAKGIQEKR